MKPLFAFILLIVSQATFSQKTVDVFTTADSTDFRLSKTSTLSFSPMPQPLETQVCVFVDPSKKFQTFIGIGAALTDAAAETFAKLPDLTQKKFLQAYFDTENGIGYTIARTNINSCDFSSDMYTYVKENDNSLSSFDISHDKQYKIPFIKKAMEASGKKLKLFASPWSPPAWMKSNNDMLHGGKLKTDYYQTWANYYVKFIREYQKAGVPVWGITIQNEPMATQRWESCIYSAEEERDFLKKYLGPTIQKQNLSSTKIIVWDHNRDLIYQRAQTILNDPEAAKYAWGIGFHWYEDWSGGEKMFENVDLVNKAFPNKNLLFTEGCVEAFNETQYKAWRLGERYAYSMIHDFNSGTVGWTDWNILLDETGGPNHVQNFCFAPVHADTRTGQLIFTNSYYYIGHFSKFIRPGAKRISAAPSRSQLLATAFQNPDGTIATVVLNRTSQKINFYLWMNGKAAESVALPHSINTYVIR
jgi:glucosylceramidase